jgi:hypothetical protein
MESGGCKSNENKRNLFLPGEIFSGIIIKNQAVKLQPGKIIIRK